MTEVKVYEIDQFRLGFIPDGSPFEGILTIEYPEHEPYSAHLHLAKPRARAQYANAAAVHSGMEKQLVENALAALCTRRVEEVRTARDAEDDEHKPQEAAPEVEQSEVDALVAEPGVLERFVEAAATCSGVIGERDLLRLQALAALSAQLAPMPSGTPLGVNVMLSGPAGRGKNKVCDAIAKVLAESFIYPFESASAKALYYAAENNPGFLRHRWLYPNEAEAVDLLVELLRPLISGGRARHRTVNKDANGRNVLQEYDLEGPISVTIPTIRNKLDKQLLTRLLIAGMEDYPGRVASHSRAVSEQLSIDHVGEDHVPLVRAWRSALLSLTGVRRVVLPTSHSDFCFDSDEVSHGARLWTNLMGLMCAHAWLEQRNRGLVTFETGEQAIVAEAEDYEVAYRIFAATCERSILNISDTHRRILDALYEMQEIHHSVHGEGVEDDPFSIWNKHFSQREISSKSGVPQSTISDNKSYLVQSLKFVEEGRGGGLRLVDHAEPSWWGKGDALAGFPKPEQVWQWWHGEGTEVGASRDDVGGMDGLFLAG
jgi:hypothetical protein